MLTLYTADFVLSIGAATYFLLPSSAVSEKPRKSIRLFSLPGNSKILARPLRYTNNNI